MTDDKDFKHLVRDEARRSGRPYTDVRAELRPAPGGGGNGGGRTGPLDAEQAAERFEAIVAAIERSIFGKPEVVRLVATALLVPGNALFTGVAGNGMTALGDGVASAIGGRLVGIDGRTGFDVAAAADWRPDDVVVIGCFDGLDVAAQVAVVEAGRRPAIVLARRHPIADRMPHPPDDETRERFLFGLELDYADRDTELRIVSEVRDRRGEDGGDGVGPAVDLAGLLAMKAAVAEVEIPDDVRRFAVDAIAATREDEALAMGGSTVTTLALVQASAAAALAAGRGRVSTDDARALLRPVLAHRVVFRPDAPADLDGVIERALRSASP